MGKDDGSQVRHLTGSEREAVERHAGKLQDVGDRGDLVRVPEDLVDVVDGVEEVSGTETAKAVFNRGLEHGRSKGEELKADDEASQDDPAVGEGPPDDNRA